MSRKPRFQIGETVRIRQWDDMEAEFGLCPDDIIRPDGVGVCFNRFMQVLCGRLFTIKDIRRYRNTFSYYFIENVEGWHIVEYMLEPAPDPLNTVRLLDGLRSLF